ncbi:hypothetical protein K474DRAFT_119710 [Panus rudis PR-1116 ss-1]|nr:hypothetical protein K474DRAFT_119710 [Panus rudis PR-1116 ss-1]
MHGICESPAFCIIRGCITLDVHISTDASSAELFNASTVTTTPRLHTLTMSDTDFYKELEEATSKPISDKSLEKANESLQKASQQTLTDSIKEIQQLVYDGNAIDTRLLSAAHLIEKADISSKDKATQLREAYVQLLWNSRSIAGSAKGAADDFAGDMLDLISMEDISNNEKITELKRWNDLTLLKGKDAIEQPKHFQELVTKLRAYADQAEKEIGNKDTEAKKKLSQLLTEIDAINKKIESLVTNVVTPIVKFLKLGAGVFGSLLNGSPEAAFKALVGVLSVCHADNANHILFQLGAIKEGVAELQQFGKRLSDTDEQRRGTLSELSFFGMRELTHISPELNAKRDALQKKVAALEAEQSKLGDASTVPASLRNIADDIDDFSKRMTKFTDIFSQLSQEQQEIQEFLKKNTPLTDPIFKSKIQLVKELLLVDSKILDIYNKAPTSN